MAIKFPSYNYQVPDIKRSVLPDPMVKVRVNRGREIWSTESERGDRMLNGLNNMKDLSNGLKQVNGMVSKDRAAIAVAREMAGGKFEDLQQMSDLMEMNGGRLNSSEMNYLRDADWDRIAPQPIAARPMVSARGASASMVQVKGASAGAVKYANESRGASAANASKAAVQPKIDPRAAQEAEIRKLADLEMARLKEDQLAQERAAETARIEAAEMARLKAEQQKREQEEAARVKAAEQARIQAEEAARLKAQEDAAKAKALEQARIQAAEAARVQAQQEAARAAEAERIRELAKVPVTVMRGVEVQQGQTDAEIQTLRKALNLAELAENGPDLKSRTEAQRAFDDIMVSIAETAGVKGIMQAELPEVNQKLLPGQQVKFQLNESSDGATRTMDGLKAAGGKADLEKEMVGLVNSGNRTDIQSATRDSDVNQFVNNNTTDTSDDIQVNSLKDIDGISGVGIGALENLESFVQNRANHRLGGEVVEGVYFNAFEASSVLAVANGGDFESLNKIIKHSTATNNLLKERDRIGSFSQVQQMKVSYLSAGKLQSLKDASQTWNGAPARPPAPQGIRGGAFSPSSGGSVRIGDQQAQEMVEGLNNLRNPDQLRKVSGITSTDRAAILNSRPSNGYRDIDDVMNRVNGLNTTELGYLRDADWANVAPPAPKWINGNITVDDVQFTKSQESSVLNGVRNASTKELVNSVGLTSTQANALKSAQNTIKDVVTLGDVSGIDKTQLTKLRNHDGKWKNQLSSNQSVNYGGLSMSGSEHASVMRGLKSASSAHLQNMGISGGVASAITAQQGSSGAFNNLVTAFESVGGLSTSHIQTLRSNQFSINSLYPSSGGPSGGARFNVDGVTLSKSQGDQIVNRMNQASSREMQLGVKLDSGEAAQVNGASFSDIFELANLSSIGGDDINLMKNRLGDFRHQLSANDDVTFNDVTLSGGQHDAVMRGLKRASADHLQNMGLSSSLVSQITNLQGSSAAFSSSGAFSNIVAAFDSMPSMSKSALETLKNNVGSFNALYPSGGASGGGYFQVDGQSMSTYQASQILQGVSQASTRELTMGVGLDGIEASQVKSKAFADIFGLANQSSIGGDDIAQLRNRVGRFKGSLSPNESVTFAGQSLSGSQHRSVLQGLNNASKDHLVSAGLSSSEANTVISERGSRSFKNIVDAFDRVTSLGAADMTRLAGQTSNFDALYPTSGGPSENAVFTVEGTSFTVGEASKLLQGLNNATTSELRDGPQLDSADATNLVNARGGGFSSMFQVANTSGIGSTELNALKAHNGQFRNQASTTDAVRYRGVSLSGAEHEDVVRAANQADRELLLGMGLSTSSTNNIVTERGNTAFKNIADLSERTGLAASGITNLKNRQDIIDAFVPKNGVQNDATSFQLEGKTFTLGEAKAVTQGVNAAGTSELRYSVGLTSTTASNVVRDRAASGGFSNILQVAEVSGVSGTQLQQMKDTVGAFKADVSSNDAINFMGKELTSGEHNSMIRAANKADAGLLKDMGLSSTVANSIVNGRQSLGAFSNVIDLQERTNIGSSGLGTLESNVSAINALVPQSGTVDGNASFDIGGVQFTVSEAQNAVQGLNNASSREMQLVSGLSSSERSQIQVVKDRQPGDQFGSIFGVAKDLSPDTLTNVRDHARNEQFSHQMDVKDPVTLLGHSFTKDEHDATIRFLNEGSKTQLRSVFSSGHSDQIMNARTSQGGFNNLADFINKDPGSSSASSTLATLDRNTSQFLRDFPGALPNTNVRGVDFDGAQHRMAVDVFNKGSKDVIAAALGSASSLKIDKVIAEREKSPFTTLANVQSRSGNVIGSKTSSQNLRGNMGAANAAMRVANGLNAPTGSFTIEGATRMTGQEMKDAVSAANSATVGQLEGVLGLDSNAAQSIVARRGTPEGIDDVFELARAANVDSVDLARFKGAGAKLSAGLSSNQATRIADVSFSGVEHKNLVDATKNATITQMRNAGLSQSVASAVQTAGNSGINNAADIRDALSGANLSRADYEGIKQMSNQFAAGALSTTATYSTSLLGQNYSGEEHQLALEVFNRGSEAMVRRALGDDGADVSSVMNARNGGTFTDLQDVAARTSVFQGSDGTHNPNENLYYESRYVSMTGRQANNIISAVNTATAPELDDAGVGWYMNRTEANEIVKARDARPGGKFTTIQQISAVPDMDSYVMTALRDEFGNRDAVNSSAPLKANIGSVKEMMAASGSGNALPANQVDVEGGAMMNAGQMRGAVRAANSESAAQLEVIHGLSASSANAISQRAATKSFVDVADLAAATGVGATELNQLKTANSRLPQNFTATSTATLGGVSLSGTEHQNMVNAANNATRQQMLNADMSGTLADKIIAGRNGGNYTTAVDLRAALSNDTGAATTNALNKLGTEFAAGNLSLNPMFNGVGFSAAEEQQVVDMVNNGDLNRMAAEAGLNASQTSALVAAKTEPLAHQSSDSVVSHGVQLTGTQANNILSAVNQSTRTQIDDAGTSWYVTSTEASNIVAARDARPDGRFTNMSQLTAVSGMDSYVVTALRDEFGNRAASAQNSNVAGMAGVVARAGAGLDKDALTKLKPVAEKYFNNDTTTASTVQLGNTTVSGADHTTISNHLNSLRDGGGNMATVLESVAGLSSASAQSVAGNDARGLTLSEMYGRGMIEAGDAAKLKDHAGLMAPGMDKNTTLNVGGTQIDGATHAQVVDHINVMQDALKGMKTETAAANLVFKADFDQGQGSTTDASRFVDASSNAKAGSPANGANVSTDGSAGAVLQLDGSNDFVKYDGTGLKNGDAKSVFAWVKPGSSQYDYERVINHMPDSSGQFVMSLKSSGSTFKVGGTMDNNGETPMTSGSFNANEWNHIGMTFDGSTTSIFVNGEKQATNSDVSWGFSGERGLILGARTDYSSKHMKGSMDDASIYNKALDATEVKQLFAQRATDFGRTALPGTPAASGLSTVLQSRAGLSAEAASAVAGAAAQPGDVGSLGSLLGEGKINAVDVQKLAQHAALFDPNITSNQEVTLGSTTVSSKNHDMIVKQLNTLRAKTPGDNAAFASALQQKGGISSATANVLADEARKADFTNIAKLYGSGKIEESDAGKLLTFAQKSSGPQDFVRSGVAFTASQNRQMTDLLNLKDANALEKAGLQSSVAQAAANRSGNFIEFTEFLDEVPGKGGAASVGAAQLNSLKGNLGLISDMSVGLNKGSNEAVSLMGRNFSADQAQAVTDIANSGNQALMEKAGFDTTLASSLASRKPTVENVMKLFVNETGRNGVAAYDAGKVAALQAGAATGASLMSNLAAGKADGVTIDSVAFSGQQASAVTDVANSGNRALMEKSGFEGTLAARLASSTPNVKNVTELYVEQTGRNGVARHDAAKLGALKSGASFGAQHLQGLSAGKDEAVRVGGVDFSAAEAAAVTSLANSDNRALMEKSGFDSTLAARLSSAKPDVKNVTGLFIEETGRNGVDNYDTAKLNALKAGAVRGAEHLAGIGAAKTAAATVQGVSLTGQQAGAITDIANSGNVALMKKSGFSDALANRLAGQSGAVKNVTDMFVNQTGTGGVPTLSGADVAQLRDASAQGAQHLKGLGASKTSAVTLAGVSLSGAEAGAITDIANSGNKKLMTQSGFSDALASRLVGNNTKVTNAADLFVNQTGTGGVPTLDSAAVNQLKATAVEGGQHLAALGAAKNAAVTLKGVSLSGEEAQTITDIANSGNAALMKKSGFSAALANQLASQTPNVANAADLLVNIATPGSLDAAGMGQLQSRAADADLLQVGLGKTKNQNVRLDGVFIGQVTNASITDVANSGNKVLMEKAGFDSTLANQLVSSGAKVSNAADLFVNQTGENGVKDYKMSDIKSLKNNAVVGQQLLDGLQAKSNESITLEGVTLTGDEHQAIITAMNLGEPGRKALVESGLDADLAAQLTANPVGNKSLTHVALNIAPQMGKSIDKSAMEGMVGNMAAILKADPMNMESNEALSLGGYTLQGDQHQALVDAMNVGGDTGARILERGGLDTSLSRHIADNKPSGGWRNFYQIAQKVSEEVTGKSIDSVQGMLPGISFMKDSVANLGKTKDDAITLGGYTLDAGAHADFVDAMNRGGEDTKILLERSGMSSQLAGHLASNKPAGGYTSLGDVALNVAGVEAGAGPALLSAKNLKAGSGYLDSALKTLDTRSNQALKLGGTTLSAQEHSAITDMMNTGGETGRNLLKRAGFSGDQANYITNSAPAGGWKSVGEFAVKHSGYQAGAGATLSDGAGLDNAFAEARNIQVNLGKSSGESINWGGGSLSGTEHQAMVDLFNMGGKEAKTLMKLSGVDNSLAEYLGNNPKKYNNIAEVEVNVGGGAKVAGSIAAASGFSAAERDMVVGSLAHLQGGPNAGLSLGGQTFDSAEMKAMDFMVNSGSQKLMERAGIQSSMASDLVSNKPAGGYDGFVEAAINTRPTVGGDALYGDVSGLKANMRMLKEAQTGLSASSTDATRVNGVDLSAAEHETFMKVANSGSEGLMKLSGFGDKLSKHLATQQNWTNAFEIGALEAGTGGLEKMDAAALGGLKNNMQYMNDALSGLAQTKNEATTLNGVIFTAEEHAAAVDLFNTGNATKMMEGGVSADVANQVAATIPSGGYNNLWHMATEVPGVKTANVLSEEDLSGIKTSSATINTGAYQANNSNMVVIDATDFDGTVARGDMRWQNGTASGATGGGIMTTNDDGYMFGGNFDKKAPRLDYRVNFQEAGTYYVHVRGQGPKSTSDSIHVGIGNQKSPTSDNMSFFNRDGLSWSNKTMDGGSAATITVDAPGEKTINVWMREDGFKLDKLVLTKDSTFSGTGTGPTVSERGQPTEGAPGYGIGGGIYAEIVKGVKFEKDETQAVIRGMNTASKDMLDTMGLSGVGVASLTASRSTREFWSIGDAGSRANLSSQDLGKLKKAVPNLSNFFPKSGETPSADTTFRFEHAKKAGGTAQAVDITRGRMEEMLAALKTSGADELVMGAGLDASTAASLKTAAATSDNMHAVVSKANMRLDDLKKVRDHNFVSQLSGNKKTKIKGVEFSKDEISNVLTKSKNTTIKELQLQGIDYNKARQLTRSRARKVDRSFEDVFKMAGHLPDSHSRSLNAQDLTRLRDTFGRNKVVTENTDVNGANVEITRNRRRAQFRNGEQVNEILGRRGRSLRTIRMRRGKKKAAEQQVRNAGTPKEAPNEDNKKVLRSRLRRLTVQQRSLNTATTNLQETMNKAMSRRANRRRTVSSRNPVTPIQAESLAKTASAFMQRDPRKAARAMAQNISENSIRFVSRGRMGQFGMLG